MRPIRITGVTGTSTPVPLDQYVPNFLVNYTLTGSGSVETTIDNIFDTTITPNWVPAIGPSLIDPVSAIRATGMSPGDVFTVRQQGTQ